MLLGCIADDFTGASDLANTLAKGGMATTQFVGVPAHAAAAECEAGVISLKSRTIPPDDAVRQSLQALDWLQAQGCRQILFKYCSTFDSTPKGNIGPVAEALLKRLGGVAVVCPVFPATGRTLFNGHLFVNGQLLSDTGMRDHPLTPMTDPDIRRWLRLQTKGEVGAVPYAVVRQGAEAIRTALAREGASGRRLVVTDAIADEDLIAIGAAVDDQPLITGGSGIALGLPANYKIANLLSGRGTEFTGSAGKAAALSGSCSTQSLAQVEAFAKRHPVLGLLPDAVMDGSMDVDRALQWMMDRIDTMPMVYSSAYPKSVKAAQAKFGQAVLAEAFETFLGRLAVRLVDAGVTRLVIGGGETSGAVVTALGAKAFMIGPEIDPGVPALAIAGSPVRIALKSGNFGSLDFYEKAARVLAGAQA
ncbi:MAG: four-carbon acid sugar kinase family protein [Methylocystis sp.]|nr:four-carbon acid sugar kinase family protein [Methylocystis sp.]MCA3583818.1 four-carbon acid sugar kinase family protein [Methylocystis sp.]MCA3586491.1 four-carbon acid sugar kinase family protein [Methylocystis sp.]MCA3589908.1 four-carbon acid sugar kinase family protein [Methylocystis sp.]